MKKLFLLRHALTHPAGEGGDRERQLTSQGLQDASHLGRVMKEKNYLPDLILCSPATRTRQTLDQVLESLPRVEAKFEKIIYEGGYAELVKLISAVNDGYQSVLLVGHNPSIHQLAASLAAEDGGLVDRLAAGYAPCTLSVLDMPRAHWADLQMGDNTLVDLIVSD